MPAGEAKERLDGRIAAFAERFGTPTFPAHVTVAGRLDPDPEKLKPMLTEVARAHAPVAITLGECDGDARWFRCLFHHVARTPGLDALHEAIVGPTQWQPHLSLCYGDLGPAEKTLLIAATEPPLGGDFLADTLHLWNTDGPVEDWRPVASFPLGA